jgi:threonine dehydrogenase-like Zn-dependent dehydrogenase
VAERGEEGVAKVRELTGGDGTHAVLECVGLKDALDTAFGVVRAGGVVSRVGAPQYEQAPVGPGVFMRNITLTGGMAPARAYIDELLPECWQARSNRAGSSTGPSLSPMCRTAIGPWPSARR